MERIDEPAELMGRPVEAVVERVVANRDSDPETVRKILTEISEEETVTREAIDEQLADLSKVVATPETRVEVTRRALTDAREAAAIIANTNTVRSRLETFEAELTALDERVEELGSRLSSLVTRAQAPDDLYEIAREIQELRAEAIDAQRDADSLATEIEEFEQKIRNPERWADELHEDIDAIEDSIQNLLEFPDSLVDTTDEHFEKTDSSFRWADAVLRHRMQKLFIGDVRTELDALEQMLDQKATADPVDEIESRLDELEALRGNAGHRLDEIAASSWSQDHSETIESFVRELEAFDSPVDWAELENELQRHRGQLADSK
jgi:chromosome segregation ATPase